MALYGPVAALALIFRSEAWQPFTLIALVMAGLLGGGCLTAIVHELGHAGAAALGGFRVTGIDIGTGQPRYVVRWKGLRVTFNSYPLSGGFARFHAPRGATRARRALAYAGGALANFAVFVGGCISLAGLTRPGHEIAVEPYALLIGVVAAQGISGLAALWPKRVRLGGQDHPSDGALLLQLARQPLQPDVEQFWAVFYEVGWLRREGRDEECLELAEAALARSPHHKYLLGVAMDAIGHVDGPEAAIARWHTGRTQVEPWGDDPAEGAARSGVEGNAAWFMLRTGDPQHLPAVLTLSEAALAASPDSWPVQATRGAALVAVGEPAAGLKLLMKALRQDGDLRDKSDFCPWLARAERACGRPERAAEYERLEVWLRRRHAHGA